LGSFNLKTGVAKLRKINAHFAAVDNIFFTCSEEPNHLDTKDNIIPNNIKI